jgi:hypothetical protein
MKESWAIPVSIEERDRIMTGYWDGYFEAQMEKLKRAAEKSEQESRMFGARTAGIQRASGSVGAIRGGPWEGSGLEVGKGSSEAVQIINFNASKMDRSDVEDVAVRLKRANSRR